MIFQDITDIKIPQGNVVKIHETNSGRVLWQKKSTTPPTPSDKRYFALSFSDVNQAFTFDENGICSLAFCPMQLRSFYRQGSATYGTDKNDKSTFSLVTFNQLEFSLDPIPSITKPVFEINQLEPDLDTYFYIQTTEYVSSLGTNLLELPYVSYRSTLNVKHIPTGLVRKIYCMFFKYSYNSLSLAPHIFKSDYPQYFTETFTPGTL